MIARVNLSSVAVVLLACLAGCFSGGNSDSPGGPAATAKSPDGRNEIRLYESPLRVEALRDGVVLVGQTRIGLRIDGRPVGEEARHRSRVDRSYSGRAASPVYKKSSVDLACGATFADFGDWGVALVARDDGVAYRFETQFPGAVRIDDERVDLAVPAGATCWLNRTPNYGCEETVTETCPAKDLAGLSARGGSHIYLPFAYAVGGKTVAVTESDVCDYPVLNFAVPTNRADATLRSDFARWPKATERVGGIGRKLARNLATGGRWVRVRECADHLVETAGARTLPWRAFLLADRPADLPAADLVWALARPPAPDDDFAWVKPGKVAWDWWNCFDNGAGCNTKTYERFIDFAAKGGVEYVIFDEGWSEKLNIWKFHPDVDVPHLIDYARRKGVGIILWMAWAQVCGEEERVAAHFARLGAKGFKVDFMDRGDAEVERFLWKFAEACRKNRMLVDYHGAHRPTGMSRAYPNVLNYEGIHGLEQMKWYGGNYDVLANDVRACFLRMTAGPMDYTPGAMLNYAPGTYPKKPGKFPGSLGTRARQMAMMALFEAPLQMLCDSPTNYEKNRGCFRFMAATPTVWDDTVALGGTPDTFAALARRAKDGAWYVAGINNSEAREFDLGFSFLGGGVWRAECFRDGRECGIYPMNFVHVSFNARPDDGTSVWMAPGGGFVMRLERIDRK